MAKLFITLATSESIHARNFKKVLSDIGAQAEAVAAFEPKVSITRKNLKLAIAVELEEIEGSPSPYFVCQNCGSTLSEIPEATCPICGGPPAKYIEIKMEP